MTRYQHLANLLAERIEQGLYRHGTNFGTDVVV